MRETTCPRTIVRGGLVVTTESAEIADVLIEDGRIAGIGAYSPGPGDRVVDADDRYVFPGGVDPHTHMDAEFRGRRTVDDFGSGTAAAIAGGTTTIVDFCTADLDSRLVDSVARWRERVAEQRPWTDFGCHMILVQPGDAVLDQLPELAAEGVCSVKLYMAYPGRMMSDDRALFKTLQKAADCDLLVLVHAENGHVIDVLVEDALAAGHSQPRWHAKTRPPLTEAEAISRASALAELAGARLYIVHVSSQQGVEAVRVAQEHGRAVSAETCPHYLVFDDSMMDTMDDESAARFVCSPPTRTTGDQDALWDALSEGVLDVVASDHCPFPLLGGKVVAGDFREIMNGLPGVEQRLTLVHHFGVNAGRMSLSRMVGLVSTNPARLAGLYPRKGAIAVGADADIVIFDPRATTTISAQTHHSAADYLPYEGITVSGTVDTVMLRGQIVFSDGDFDPAARSGAYVHRSTDSMNTRVS